MPDTAHFDALSAAVVAADVEGRVVYTNRAAQTVYGRTRGEMLGADLMSLLVPEEEHGPAGEILGQVLGGARWIGEFNMMCAGAVVRPLRITQSPLHRGDDVVGLLLVAEETAGLGSDVPDVRLLGERLTNLAHVTAELARAEDLETVTKVVISHAADAVGATVASLSLLTAPETLSLVGLRGGREGAAARWATYSIHADTPASEAVRTGQRVLLVGRDAIRERYPHLETAASGERTLICLPLMVAARPVGAISLSFPGRRVIDAAELEFFGILADTCAQGLDRMQAVVEAASRAAKLAFLADASSEMSASLDYRATLAKVARLAVPDFADWSVISVLEDDELHTLAVAHSDPAKVAMAEEVQRRYPGARNAPRGSWNVVRTGASELIHELDDEMLAKVAVDEEHLRLIRALELRSALQVPLTIHDRVLGVMTWIYGESERRYTKADVAFAEDLARRAAVAIDNAHLHSETHETAIRLQHAVLPQSLPNLAGWELAAHYSPASRTEVGGDFYDVIPLDEGRLAMFVGDVMGRGVAAAAAMAQMRSAVRAYIAVDPDPVAVMEKLDLMFSKLDIAQFVTLVYLVVDPAQDEFEVINAGHLPPLILRADGSSEHLPFADAAPLGVGPAERRSHVMGLSEGDTLLVYTDGLIEQRAEDIGAGQKRLVASCVSIDSRPLITCLDELVEAVRDHTRQDDIAVLAARRTARSE